MAMLAFAAEVERKSTEFAEVETRQTGKGIRLASGFDVPGAIDNNIYFFAGAARQHTGQTRSGG